MDGLGDGAEAGDPDPQRGRVGRPAAGGTSSAAEYSEGAVAGLTVRPSIGLAQTSPPDCPARPVEPGARRAAGDRLVARRRRLPDLPAQLRRHDGNGVGDLPGILDHLDHLGPDGLGVDAIWLSPIYPSPGRDLGYDVSDHTAVDPLLRHGRRLRPARRRRPTRAGIRVILDLVMNHTSDEHAWFLRRSRRRATGPYADLYLWRDPSGCDADGEPLPPNNWLSFFGGSGLGVGAERGSSSTAHVPRRAARAELAEPGGRGGPVGDGPRLARPRRRRLPARRLQRLPQAPGAAATTRCVDRATRRGTARSTSTTATSRTSRS